MQNFIVVVDFVLFCFTTLVTFFFVFCDIACSAAHFTLMPAMRMRSFCHNGDILRILLAEFIAKARKSVKKYDREVSVRFKWSVMKFWFKMC